MICLISRVENPPISGLHARRQRGISARRVVRSRSSPARPRSVRAAVHERDGARWGGSRVEHVDVERDVHRISPDDVADAPHDPAPADLLDVLRVRHHEADLRVVVVLVPREDLVADADVLGRRVSVPQ
jgi:hypothetical protein